MRTYANMFSANRCLYTTLTLLTLLLSVSHEAASQVDEDDHVYIYPSGGDDAAEIANKAKEAYDNGKVLSFADGEVFLVSKEIFIEDRSHFTWRMNQATIKMMDCVETRTLDYNILQLAGCTDFVIENGIFDGNQQNRMNCEGTEEAETCSTFANGLGNVNIMVQDGCKRFRFEGVTSINAILDGFNVKSWTDDPAEFPSTGSFVDCYTDACCRCGISLHNAYDIDIIGGSHRNTWRGISMEPDAPPSGAYKEPPIDKVRISGVHIEDARYGVTLPNSYHQPEKGDAAIVTGCTFTNCDEAAIYTAAPMVVTGNTFTDFSELRYSVVRIVGGDGSIVSDNMFRNVFGSTACIYTRPEASNVIIANNTAYNVTKLAGCRSAGTKITGNIVVYGENPMKHGIAANGDFSVISNNYIENAGHGAIIVGEEDPVVDILIEGNQIVNCVPSSTGDIYCGSRNARVYDNVLDSDTESGLVGVNLAGGRSCGSADERDNKVVGYSTDVLRVVDCLKPELNPNWRRDAKSEE